MGLVACPFCREMFEEGEADKCPVCGVALTAFEKLPASAEANVTEDGVPIAPHDEVLPWAYFGRGRGPIFLLALAGLVLFMLPWIHETMPNIVDYSGFDLAKRLGWSWGAGVAWVVLIPTVLSRRTIRQLRGARVAAAFLAAVPAVTGFVLTTFAHARSWQKFAFATPIYVTMALSIAAFFFAIRLGGRVDDIKVKRGTSAGQTVH